MSQPIKRVHFSNEKLQGFLFTGIVINLIPGFMNRDYLVPYFIFGLVISLVIDTILNFIRFRRLVCSVSAGITYSVIFYLSPSTDFTFLIVGSSIGLILGKHIWGGTGKNPVNPALLGLLVIGLFTSSNSVVFTPLLFILIPAIILRILPSMTLLLSYLLIYFLTGHIYPVGLFLALVVVIDPVTIRGGLRSSLIIFTINTVALIFTDNLYIPIILINIIQEIIYRVDNSFFREKKSNLKLKKVFRLVKTPPILEDYELPTSISENSLMTKIKSSNIQGQGGGGFPLSSKIESLLDKRNTLIINCVECDPGLLHDKWILKNYREFLEGTASIVRESLGFKELFFVSKESYKSNSVEYRGVKDYYPSGWEINVLRDTLGIDVEYHKRPSDYGVLVINIQTLLHIGIALSGNPITHKYITVGNLKDGTAEVKRVNIGDIIDSRARYAGGGIFASIRNRGKAVIDSKLSSIYYGVGDKFKNSPQCSRCGLCKRYCPVGLDPNGVDETLCIKCGSCSYICLAGRTLPSIITE